MEFIQENIWLLPSAAVVMIYIWKKFGLRLRGISQVDPRQANSMVEGQGAVVVDVREAREYASARIPGSRNVPDSEFIRRIAEIEKHKNKPIVVSCRSGARSARACVLLKKKGFDDVYNLKGGIKAWHRADLDLEV